MWNIALSNVTDLQRGYIKGTGFKIQYLLLTCACFQFWTDLILDWHLEEEEVFECTFHSFKSS